MLPELEQLNQIRLEEDLTYTELATRIGMKDGSALNRLLRDEREPMDRTLYKIRKFLSARQSPRPKRRAS
jgi:transcriptional regulator with XRE-family HTH domain